MATSLRKPQVAAHKTLAKALGAVLLALPLAGGVDAGATLAGFGFSDDREGVTRLLQLLADNQKGVEDRYSALVARLDDERFPVREAATKELCELPVIDRVALLQIKAQVPPEAATRIARALKENTAERYDEIIQAALESIIDNEFTGMVDLMFRALDKSTRYKRGMIWNLCGDAARATAQPEDLEVLKRALKSEAPMVRGASVAAILEVAGDEAIDIVLPAASDPDQNVKWMVARELVAARRRECLKPLAELLMCDDFGLRWRALEELRNLSGEDFGYYAAGDANERAEPAQKWLDWVERDSASADLAFGGDEEEEREGDEVSLFNGEDLTGWKEYPDADKGIENGIARAVLFSSWRVEGGYLGCTGLHPGCLRSERSFANYSLTLEYILHGGRGQSGVAIFANESRGEFLEIQLKQGKTGDLYQRGEMGLTGDDGNPIAFMAEKLAGANERPGEWNRLEIRVKDGSVVVKVNDLVQNRIHGGPKGARGVLLLDKGDAAEFRAIKLRKL